MAIATVYKKILDFELWHDYFLGQPDGLTSLPDNYDSSNLLTIEPTADCLQVLKNLRWVFRTQPYGASIFVPVNEIKPANFQPQIEIDRPERLTFWLVVRDRYFTNFTNLSLATSPNKIYYFSNFTGNDVSSLLFLTQSLPIYVAKAEYALGQLLKRGNKTLEALTYQAEAKNTPNDSDWQTFPGSQYVSGLDYLPRQALSRIYPIPTANPRDIFKLKLIDVNGVETLVMEVIATDKHPPGSPLLTNLDLTGQRPGRYQLNQNGTEVDNFVIVDPRINRDVLGLVEISLNSSQIKPAFALLKTNAGKIIINPKTYLLRFKNRLTRWRYRHQQPHGFKREDLPGSFDYIDEKTYATKQLLGSRSPSGYLLTDGKDRPLQSPSVTLIKPEIDVDRHVTNIFSDIHL
jgi:hypothetical protein